MWKCGILFGELLYYIKILFLNIKIKPFQFSLFFSLHLKEGNIQFPGKDNLNLELIKHRNKSTARFVSLVKTALDVLKVESVLDVVGKDLPNLYQKNLIASVDYIA